MLYLKKKKTYWNEMCWNQYKNGSGSFTHRTPDITVFQELHTDTHAHMQTYTHTPQNNSKSSHQNNLNNKRDAPKSYSKQHLEAVPSNWLPPVHSALSTLDRYNLAHCPHGMQKKCRVVWSLLCHHHTLLPRVTSGNTINLFFVHWQAYIVFNSKLQRGSDCAAQGCSNH